MTRVAVAGAGGRMGQRICELVSEAGDLVLAAALEAPGSARIGSRAAAAVEITDDAEAALKAADVYIDFTRPEPSLALAAKANDLGIAGVIGTTGFAGDPRQQLQAAAPGIPLVWAPNMSIGVNLLLQLVEQAARALPADAYDCEIVEFHHRWKVDAPSGTANALLEAVRRGRGDAAPAVHGREGITGARSDGPVGMHAGRAGDIVGDHMVLLAGGSERLELTHRAHTRDPFVHGALRAARWVRGRTPGVWGMADVLGGG